MGTTLAVTSSPEQPLAPAFYARASGRGRARDWWALLHPPYTAWHLATVVIGACLATHVSASRLAVTVLAFFLAVGLAAHALDELNGRPLRTTLPTPVLVAVSVLGLAGAVALGVVGAVVVSGWLALFIVAGVALALAYNLELFGGVLHGDAVFALAWGGFPVLTAGFAQGGRLTWPIAVGAVAGSLLAAAQRALSTPARRLRRRVADVSGRIVNEDGSVEDLSVGVLLQPLELALRLLSAMVVATAAAILALRFKW